MSVQGTYNDVLPTDRDKLRALIGDTDVGALLLSDSHLDAVLLLKGSLNLALAFCADELIARFANQPVAQTSQGETVDYRERIATWKLISAQAKADAAATTSTSGNRMTFVPMVFTDASEDEYAA